MVLPDKESYHMQKKKLTGQLAMLFGGRVAEAIFCGDISAGAHDDIRKATDLARAMVTELGMSDKIGPINYSERQGSDFLGTELMRGKLHSEETAREIDEEVQGILTTAYEKAETIVREHSSELEVIAEVIQQRVDDRLVLLGGHGAGAVYQHATGLAGEYRRPRQALPLPPRAPVLSRDNSTGRGRPTPRA